MSDHPLISGAPIDVAIIGGGPAGLAAATALKAAGIARVVVLEREPAAGGIPRHCGHPPFGMREFRRVLRGPDYAARLVTRAERAGVEIHSLTTVIEARKGGALLIAVPEGVLEIMARRVIYATGVREKPRAARLITGARVQGVLNTGALQSMVFIEGRRPFRRPVIIGSELVAFSAIMTSRHAGIKPVAMIEANSRAAARWPSALYPVFAGVKLLTNTALLAIHGERSVKAVSVTGPDGQTREIACDGVIISGQFTPESTLARCGHLEVDPATNGPVVDQWGRCSDPTSFATGNLLRPVETAGWSWQEGRKTGAWVADDLAGKLPAPQPLLQVEIERATLKYAMPQRLDLANVNSGMGAFQLRVNREIRGKLVALQGDNVLWCKSIHALPERRILVPQAAVKAANAASAIRFEIRT